MMKIAKFFGNANSSIVPDRTNRTPENTIFGTASVCVPSKRKKHRILIVDVSDELVESFEGAVVISFFIILQLTWTSNVD